MGNRLKSIRPLAVVSLAIFTVACAQNPEKVLAFSVSEEAYAERDCAGLNDEATRLGGALDVEYENQRKARSNDAAGVFFLGLPVASMSGRNRSDEIARLKGELNAVENVAQTQNCDDVVASIKSTRAARNKK